MKTIAAFCSQQGVLTLNGASLRATTLIDQFHMHAVWQNMQAVTDYLSLVTDLQQCFAEHPGTQGVFEGLPAVAIDVCGILGAGAIEGHLYPSPASVEDLANEEEEPERGASLRSGSSSSSGEWLIQRMGGTFQTSLRSSMAAGLEGHSQGSATHP